MPARTINVLITKCATIAQAVQAANQEYAEQLQVATKGQKGLSVSMSHSTGLELGKGFYCSIIATVVYD